jgi:hypothetical protein
VNRTTIERSVVIAGIVLLMCGLTWVVWPRPALQIEIEPGGHASVITHFSGKQPLRDTVRLASRFVSRFVGHSRTYITIDNRDTVLHRLGIFAVGPESSRTFVVPGPGVYSGFCSAHPGREITYIVRP